MLSISTGMNFAVYVKYTYSGTESVIDGVPP